MDNKTINRVLVIGNLFPDSFADNILITLKRMDFTVAILPINPMKNTTNSYIRIMGSYLVRALTELEKAFSNRLAANTIKFEPDLVIVTDSGVPPQTIEMIKDKTAATVVCWFTDPAANMDRQYILAAPYDILFMKEPFMVELFSKKLNKVTYYLPEACNPLWHKKVDISGDKNGLYECDIALAGNMYYYRALLLEHLITYRMKIWGPVFPRWLNSPVKKMFQGKYVARQEKAKAFRSAKINLNTLSPSEINGVNCRMFEIAGCGGFQIVDAKPALSDLFDIDREIVTFETLKELKEKVAYYMTHDIERQAIARKSYERAHKEHTYEHRLIKLISVVEDIVRK